MPFLTLFYFDSISGNGFLQIIADPKYPTRCAWHPPSSMTGVRLRFGKDRVESKRVGRHTWLMPLHCIETNPSMLTSFISYVSVPAVWAVEPSNRRKPGAEVACRNEQMESGRQPGIHSTLLQHSIKLYFMHCTALHCNVFHCSSLRCHKPQCAVLYTKQRSKELTLEGLGKGKSEGSSHRQWQSLSCKRTHTISILHNLYPLPKTKATNTYLPGKRVYSGPSRVSDISVSAENIIYEAFVVIGVLRWSFSSMLAWRKKRVDKSPSFIFKIFSRNTTKRSPTLFPHHNKGFINYVSCRNTAGTRPDSLAWYINK